jgi:Helix-turn-helix domain
MPFAKVSVVAADYGVSRHTLYDWIRRGIVPESCVIRIGSSVRIDPEKFRNAVKHGDVGPGPRPPPVSANLTDSPPASVELTAPEEVR